MYAVYGVCTVGEGGGKKKEEKKEAEFGRRGFLFRRLCQRGRGGGGRGRFMIVESDIGREILGFIAFSEEQKENF